ncbi:uncharacterized protein SOCEGT47_003690 [Sorangium cellulosum]|uniref:Uncharacterized protein n=1 Tax=Sorangium cellulosum TaxID=56 RepID=A0A4P2PTC0_SORCE|nr:hypothetical protein [Sorangium cellulosum]AUX19915.1 uncharacterized protein SOCEGT47_003690 [Sorangium cellulosum]
MTSRKSFHRGLDTLKLPASLALRLDRRDEHVELRIDGVRVMERPVGRGRRTSFARSFPKAQLAEIVFEHRLAKLRADGFTTGSRPFAGAHPEEDMLAAAHLIGAQLERHGDPTGTLIAFQVERLRHDGDDARALARELLDSTKEMTFGPIPDFGEPFACVDDGHGGLLGWGYDDDAATIDEVLRPELELIGRDALGFSPDGPDVSLGVVGLHRLRRLLANPAGRSLRSLRLMTFGALGPFLDLLNAHGCASVITSLVARGASPAIGAALPGLRGLGAPERALGVLLAQPAQALRYLTVFRGDDDVRGAIAPLRPERLPALEHLGLWYRPTRAEGLRVLAAHPLIQRIQSLEIWSTDDARRLPFEDLLALRPSLSHLARILLGGHLVPSDVRERFADWPAVEFVSHDRREVIALDIAALGWARALR